MNKYTVMVVCFGMNQHKTEKTKMYGGYASMPALRGLCIGFQISSTGEGIVTVHRSQGQGSFITVNEKYRNI